MDFQCNSEYQFKIYHSLKIIREFNWLLNSYVLDFFVDDHWNKLPFCWREAFDNMEPSNLGELLLGGKPKIVLPLSFMALLTSLKILSIPRDYAKSNNLMNANVSTGKHLQYNKEESFNHPRLIKLFTKHVKNKKRHEISLISQLVGKISEEEQCSSVVDIGSGLGHLVRTLSYKYKLKTVGIERQNNLTAGARDLDNEFEYTALKYLQSDCVLNSYKPQHINLMLTSEMPGHILSETLRKYVDNSYGFVGLHPCGDLGPLLMRIFIESPDVKFICIVGCCYMKLSCQGAEFRGYPLSDFVSNIKNNELSYESREIACHAIETYCQRLIKGLYEDLQVHTFRAILEKILVSKWPDMKHIGLRSIKHYNTLTFQRYCEIATERLGVQLTAEDTSSESVNSCLKMWKKIVIFYTLRLLLAPLVESVILMDRVLSLREKGATCEVHALFDPLVSPRNQILIARKI